MRAVDGLLAVGVLSWVRFGFYFVCEFELSVFDVCDSDIACVAGGYAVAWDFKASAGVWLDDFVSNWDEDFSFVVLGGYEAVDSGRYGDL